MAFCCAVILRPSKDIYNVQFHKLPKTDALECFFDLIIAHRLGKRNGGSITVENFDQKVHSEYFLQIPFLFCGVFVVWVCHDNKEKSPFM